MNFGEQITLWTIRVAIAFYGLSVAAQLMARGRAPWRSWGRTFWTTGCVIYIVHVLVAFHYYHHWSHAAVFEHTARRTEAVVGAPVGYGVYVSYLFTLLWTVDVMDWWRRGLASYAERPRWLQVLWHSFFAFIVFNGTVVFETGPIRWLGLGMFALFAILLGRNIARRD